MMTDKEIYRWKLPEDHHDFTGHDDLPEAYKIEENLEATCGIVISGKYHEEWVANPWNTRTLVKHLLDKAEKAEAENAEFEEIIRLKNGLIFQLVERCEKAETELDGFKKEYISMRDEVDRWKRLFSREFESRKADRAEVALMDQHTRESIEESAIIGERKRIVGIIDGANHAFIDGARMVSVDAVKDLIEKE